MYKKECLGFMPSCCEDKEAHHIANESSLEVEDLFFTVDWIRITMYHRYINLQDYCGCYHIHLFWDHVGSEQKDQVLKRGIHVYWDVNSPIQRDPIHVYWLGVHEGIDPNLDLWVYQEYSCT